LKLQSLRTLAISAVIACAVIVGSMLTVPRSYADPPDHAKCQREIERREIKLSEAIRKHGERSHQVNDRRRDLNAERERCWNTYHGWWDGREGRWHEDRDWDRDHDRDDHR
jgi:hypothetical protein